MQRFLSAVVLAAYAIVACESCSFIVTNIVLSNETLENANVFNKRRGPDATNVVRMKDWMFVHNLLSMTGAFTLQPFLTEDNVHHSLSSAA